MIAVHVLIDLHWQNAVGGHVKSWLQFAKAAQTIPEQAVDLTLHFHGDRPQEISLSSNVRYVLHTPGFSTQRLPFLRDAPSHTDLCPNAPTLIPYLERSDLVHTTHPLLTFGSTAQRVCNRLGIPLVSSIHTDVPLYAKIYIEEKIQQLLGETPLSRFLRHTLHLPQKYQASLERKQNRHWQSCQHVWYSQPHQQQDLRRSIPNVPISRLRRGLDREVFNPQKRDRHLLQKRYGIPADAFLLLFVGRLDPCKNLMTYGKTLKILLERQLPVHGVVVGKGDQGAQLKSLLGKHVSLLGTLEQENLGFIYASTDLFVFPSETEIAPNVVIEAKASGLIPCVSDQGGVTQLIETSGQDGLIIAGQNPIDWADQIQSLYEQPQKRELMQTYTYKYINQGWPPWETVYKEDLLPVWLAIAEPSSSRKMDLAVRQ